MRSIPVTEQLEAATSCMFHSEIGCAVAGALIGTGPVACLPSSCVACLRSRAPMRLNETTLALAKTSAKTQAEQGAAILAEEKLKVIIRQDVASPFAKTASDATSACANGKGPGSELWRILESVGITHRQPNDFDPTSCGCAAYCLEMNAWGPDGCRKRINGIVEHLKIEAAQRRSDKRQTIRQRALAWCFTNWGARKLVELSISRAELSE